jgi:hypothetical protein
VDFSKDIDIDTRATAARLGFERAATRVEKVQPATSARVRLQAMALGRELRARRRSLESYAVELESLRDELLRALDAPHSPLAAAPAGAPS